MMIRARLLTNGSVVWIGCALSAMAQIGSEVVHFATSQPDSPGQAVYVLGDIPQLGGNEMTAAVRMVPGMIVPGTPPLRNWSVDIALPASTTFTYAFAARDETVGLLAEEENGTLLTEPTTGSTAPLSPSTTPTPFYKNNAGPATSVTFHIGSGAISVPLESVPGHDNLLVAVFPYHPLSDGIDAEINGRTVVTPLHRLLRRGGHVYNYVSDADADFEGFVETFVIETTTVASTRTVNGDTGRGIRVRLPRGYVAHVQRRYPVVYLHDGQAVLENGDSTWGVDTVAADLIRRGQVRELILVAIDNSVNRLREYNPDWPDSLYDDYGRFFVDELMPVINARYRTLTAAADTGVIGSSFGGVASLALALDHPDRFGRVGAMSTSFWASDVGERLGWSLLPTATRLYLDVGDTGDAAEDTIQVRDTLLAGGRVLEQDLFFQIGYGHEHVESAWRARIDEALLALFPITDEENTIDLPIPLPGDINVSGCVDLSDVALMTAAYGACAGDAAYDPAVDLNASGCVDISDLAEVLGNFGLGCN